MSCLKNCNSKLILYRLETIPAVVTIEEVESA